MARMTTDPAEPAPGVQAAMLLRPKRDIETQRRKPHRAGSRGGNDGPQTHPEYSRLFLDPRPITLGARGVWDGPSKTALEVNVYTKR